MSKVRYYWVKFWPAGEWQVVKFYEQGGQEYLRGMDWGCPHKIEAFANKEYELGPEIPTP